jgi:hypothetical protein
LIERPTKPNPEDVRFPMSCTIDPEDYESFKRQRGKEFTLGMLVLKKAELQIELDVLEGELMF